MACGAWDSRPTQREGGPPRGWTLDGQGHAGVSREPPGWRLCTLLPGGPAAGDCLLSTYHCCRRLPGRCVPTMASCPGVSPQGTTSTTCGPAFCRGGAGEGPRPHCTPPLDGGAVARLPPTGHGVSTWVRGTGRTRLSPRSREELAT